ncbi:MAG: efflux RND transporter periplasmic adaptor subunit [Armatimonas sp.]
MKSPLLTLALLPLSLLLWGCQPKEVPTLPASEEKAKEHEGEGHADEHGGSIELSEAAKKNAGIRTQVVTQRPVQATREVPGTVEVAADRATKLTPSAAGKIVSLLARPGDSVQAGQALAILDSFEVAQGHAAVEQAEAGVSQAIASLQTAQAEVRQAAAAVGVADAAISQAEERARSARQALIRQKELAAAGAFAQAPLQSAQSELSGAQSDLLKSQTELQGHLVVLQRAERLFKEEVISRAELEQAQLEHRQDETNVETARKRVENARLTLEREKRIAQAGLLNAREVQTAEATLRDADAEVRKARTERIQSVEARRKAEHGVTAARTTLFGTQAALRAARTSLYALEGPDHAPGQGGRIVVKAPISGIVAERGVTQGETVERTTVLYTLQNEGVVQVTAQVPEAEVGTVRVGQNASISVAAFPDARFSGRVTSVGSQINEKTRSLPVRLLVSNPTGKLKPRMFARVVLGVSGSRQALTVPEAALVKIEGKPHVFVEEAGKYEKRQVALGTRAAGGVELKSGVSAGESVVIEGAFVLKSEANKEALAGHED